MRLTQKQELFTEYIFQGMTQREAWGKAGYSTKYPIAIIDSKASALANSGKVKVGIRNFRIELITARLCRFRRGKNGYLK